MISFYKPQGTVHWKIKSWLSYSRWQTSTQELMSPWPELTKIRNVPHNVRSISSRLVSSRSLPDCHNDWKSRSVHLFEILEIWNFHYNRPTPVFRNYYWFRQERIYSLGLEKKGNLSWHIISSFHFTLQP